jgi:hypothetical protein
MNDETPTTNKSAARKSPNRVVPTSSEPTPSYRRVFTWVFLILSAVFTVIIGALGLWATYWPENRAVTQHFAAVVGLPFAVVASLFIVLVCDVRAGGKMNFQALGFKFEGASSQVALWVLCFLAVTLAIKVLW